MAEVEASNLHRKDQWSGLLTLGGAGYYYRCSTWIRFQLFQIAQYLRLQVGAGVEVAFPAVEAKVVVRGAEQIEDVVVCPLKLDVETLIWALVQTVVSGDVRVAHCAFFDNSPESHQLVHAHEEWC